MKTPRTLIVVAAALALCAIAVLPLACFSLKDPPCAFSCQTPPHACPTGYSCLADGLCHRQGAQAACDLTPPGDAGTDGAVDGSGPSADGGD